MPATFDHADFTYDTANGGGGVAACVAIFAEDAGLRSQIREDLGGAGFRTVDGGAIGSLLDGPVALIGDVVLVDCPVVGPGGLDAATLAGLARLDMRIANAGARLIAATNMEGLDDLFGVLDQCAPQILVSPSRAERVIAVGRAMGEAGAGRVREMGEDDRIALLRLSQQVEAIAHSLDRLSHGQALAGPPVVAGQRGDVRADSAVGNGSVAAGAGRLPDPALVRQMIANRQARAKFFDADLFGDPAWDMLLDLTAAHGEGRQVSVTSLCIAAGVPATTALRWLTQLVDSGIFVRVPDPADRRRAFIGLSDKALAAMAGYFASLRTPVAHAA